MNELTVKRLGGALHLVHGDNCVELQNLGLTLGEMIEDRDAEIERIGATESLYEELRSIIDGGSESMTHEDAVQELRDRDEEREQLRAFARLVYDRDSVPAWAHDAAAKLLGREVVSDEAM